MEIPRRFSAWKIMGIVLLAPASGLIPFGAWARQKAEQQWPAFEREIESLLNELNARECVRDSPAMGSLPGNAWDDYIAARKKLPNWSGREIGVLRLYMSHAPTADRAQAAAALSSAEDALTLLRQGAKRCKARYPPSERRDESRGMAGYQGASARFTEAAVSTAVMLDAGSHRDQAIEVLIDLVTFGRDLIDRGFQTDVMDGEGVVNSAFKELESILRRGHLESSMLRRLEQRLELLDATWPDVTAALRSALLRLGVVLLEEDRSGNLMREYSGYPRIRSSWTSFYSTRLRALQTFRTAERYTQKVQAALELPPEEGDPIIMGIYQNLSNSSEPLLHDLYTIYQSPSLSWQRAKLRLFRLLVHYQATGEVLAIDDPLRGKLRLVHENGHVRVWRETTGGEKSPSGPLLIGASPTR